MPSDSITCLKFLLPGIFYAILWARPGYLKIQLPYISQKFMIGNRMTLHIRKLRVHSNFVSMPSFLARWYLAKLCKCWPAFLAI